MDTSADINRIHTLAESSNGQRERRHADTRQAICCPGNLDTSYLLQGEILRALHTLQVQS